MDMKKFSNQIKIKPIKRLGKLSDELYKKIFYFVSVEKSYGFKTRMIHLADAVDCGTITPMEAYDALEYIKKYGYFPQQLIYRESNYSHLLLSVH